MKELKPESFEEGYVTKILGTIPKFKYNYNMDLKEKLIALGVTDVFDAKKADLSKLVKGQSYIAKSLHAANIEFTEYGIKAAAVTLMGGVGNAEPCTYTEKMKVKEIDLTFDKPYMYIIRDKKTGEVWFTGSVVEPTEFTNN
jgi:serine protease inhibitor